MPTGWSGCPKAVSWAMCSAVGTWSSSRISSATSWAENAKWISADGQSRVLTLVLASLGVLRASAGLMT